jgi:hypothetical protein
MGEFLEMWYMYLGQQVEEASKNESEAIYIGRKKKKREIATKAKRAKAKSQKTVYM